jgi:hypothetical protein
VARAGLPAATKFVRSLEPLVEVLDPTAKQIAPVASYMAAYRKELVGTMANVAASQAGSSIGTNGRRVNYFRTLLPLGPEGLVGYGKRLPTNRHNAYGLPGGLADLLGGLESSNCEDATGGGSAPPCKVQPGWSFGGADKRYYPHVDPAKPPKR